MLPTHFLLFALFLSPLLRCHRLPARPQADLILSGFPNAVLFQIFDLREFSGVTGERRLQRWYAVAPPSPQPIELNVRGFVSGSGIGSKVQTAPSPPRKVSTISLAAPSVSFTAPNRQTDQGDSQSTSALCPPNILNAPDSVLAPRRLSAPHMQLSARKGGSMYG